MDEFDGFDEFDEFDEENKESKESSSKRSPVKIDQETLLRPFLTAPNDAVEWLEQTIGFELSTPPAQLNIEIPHDLEQLSNIKLSNLLAQLATVKGYLRSVQGEVSAHVRSQKEAVDLIKKEIKKQLGSSNAKTTLTIDTDRNVVKAKQLLNKYQCRAQIIEDAYKQINDKYSAISRIVNLRLNEDEDNRRCSYTDNLRPRNSGMPGTRSIRRADRVANQIRKQERDVKK